MATTPLPRRGALTLALALGLLTAHPASVRGQTPTVPTEPPAPASPATPPAVEDPGKPMGPPDPLNRGTPRGSMYGFITASRAGDYEKAAQFLDLRRLPPAKREEAPELARRFKAVLDRTLWVEFANLSDRNEGIADDGLPAWQDRLGDIETREGLVTLMLQRVPRADDEVRIWKVGGATVLRIPELYAEFGPGRLEAFLPAVFFERHVLEIALWQWLGILLVALGGWIVSLLLAGSLIRVLGLVLTRGEGGLDSRVVAVVRGPVRLGLTVALFAVGRRYLGLDVPVQDAFRILERVVWVVAFWWLVFRVIDIVVLNLRVRAESLGNTGLIPVLVPTQRLAKVLIVLVGVLGVLGTLGVNISAVVAGLGVGGIAVALAAQRSLEHLFGGVSLFADRPVRVGDFFRYGTEVGTVEEIGLRSTRIRTLDRTVVTIPNAEFSNLRLENFALRDRMRLVATLGVRYETTPDQLRFLLTRLREVLLAHPRVLEDPARARFIGFGAFSLDIEVFAYVDTSDWNEFLGIREDLYLRFMDAVAEAGTGFAFPSSTTYLARDGGLDEEEARRAEAQVEAWRERGELPFPHLPEGRRAAVWNSDDWPPAGSPGGRPRRTRDAAPGSDEQ